jgi:type II secretory pathway predicted ATPase ExeA
MYLEFYGFQTNPFHPSRDAAFYYPSRSHRDALAELQQAIAQRNGLMLITGPSGTGKSSLLEELSRRLMRGGKTTSIVFTNPLITFSKLVHTIHDRLFPEQQPAANIEELLAQIKKELTSPRTRGWNIAILVDEAQHLPTDTLAQLGRLLKIKASEGRVFQMVLVGQPDLPPRFETRRLDHLGELIHSRCEVTPLDDQETRSYIDHRVRVAAVPGHDFVFPFSRDLVDEIAERAEGRPANINRLCHQALVIGARYHERPIRLETGLEALPQRAPRVRARFAWRRSVLAALLAASAIVAALWIAPRLRDTYASDREVLSSELSQPDPTADLAARNLALDPEPASSEFDRLSASSTGRLPSAEGSGEDAEPSLDDRIDSWVTTLNELENEPRAVTWVSEDPNATVVEPPSDRGTASPVRNRDAQNGDAQNTATQNRDAPRSRPALAKDPVSAPAQQPENQSRRGVEPRSAVEPSESADIAADPPPRPPEADVATISIASYPVAEVFVDARPVGKTPLLDLEIPIGKRFIEAVVDGRRQTRVEVLRRGEHRSLTFRFENDAQR